MAVVAGEAIAGEANSGMLRYLLVRPVGRTRLLVAKLVSIVVFMLFAVLSVAISSFVIGRKLLGTQPGAEVVVSVSDYQEAKNMEDVAAITPNTATLRTTVRVG
mgnify:CR=1 FL=1